MCWLVVLVALAPDYARQSLRIPLLCNRSTFVHGNMESELGLFQAVARMLVEQANRRGDESPNSLANMLKINCLVRLSEGRWPLAGWLNLARRRPDRLPIAAVGRGRTWFRGWRGGSWSCTSPARRSPPAYHRSQERASRCSNGLRSVRPPSQQRRAIAGQGSRPKKGRIAGQSKHGCSRRRCATPGEPPPLAPVQ